MQTVLLLVEYVEHEESYVHGVYSSYEKLSEAIGKMPKSVRGKGRFYDYKECTMDEMPKELQENEKE